jgi:beta-galactosidase
MRNSPRIVAALLIFAATGSAAQLTLSEEITLEGEWAFQLDPESTGVARRWFESELPGTARLPGSLDEQGLGVEIDEALLNRLTKTNAYVGAAWYQRFITIPTDWRGQRVQLFLERCLWESQVWIDGSYVGMQDSLSTPHVHDFPEALSPGKHRLTIRIDNTVKVNIGHSRGGMLWTHAITEETQTNWNGIIGRIELHASPLVRIESIQAFPDLENKRTRVRVNVANDTGGVIAGTLDATVSENGGSVRGVAFSVAASSTVVELQVPFGLDPGLWAEFSSVLHDLEVTLVARVGDEERRDSSSIRFGLREFRADGSHFALNGRRLFLRGNVDCAIFPLTGYPPMDVETWLQRFRVRVDHGMNHVRFHSWCPPEAAFAAADSLGVVLQVEPPLWDGHGLVGSDRERAVFILREADRIVDAYGNHPSFCMMSLGNELGDGSDPYLRYLVDYLRKKDSRHLYTSTTHPPDLDRADDFFVGAGTDRGPVRGLRPFGDFRGFLEEYDRPFVTHEVGQPAMYPDFDEIEKYTGHLKPRNLIAFGESLENQGMLHLAEEFRRASGRLLVEIYKENIEAQLRTPNVAGFQLLDLQDFPGQGTALVGILDAFGDSKGLVTPREFRRFCGPTVPLFRTRAFLWTSNETFEAAAEISHYGAEDLIEVSPVWSITSDGGEIFASGHFDTISIPAGGVTSLGRIETSLEEAAVPGRFKVEVSLPGTEIANSWKIWIYPERLPAADSGKVSIARCFDDETRRKLEAGEAVLFLPEAKSLEHALPARWHPVFWAWQLFRSQPSVMGILCSPLHPALHEFPTDFHSDWQWRGLLDRSEALPLAGVPRDLLPIVQFVPDFNLNQKLSAIFEARVGEGRLVVCTIDLLTELESRPAARQLRHSLLSYMRSDRFQPKHSLEGDLLDELLRPAPVVEGGDEPTDPERAVLNIRAAKNAAPARPETWASEADQPIVIGEGFDYRVDGGTWRDARSSAWHAGHLVVTVTCPPRFVGAFYAHFHDWNEQGRSAALFFNGRDLGPLPRYNGDGFWLRVPITEEESAQGQLVLDARVTQGPNVMISQVVLIPAKP